MVFSAPSGAGKTTLLTYLIERVQGLVYSISATTRQPRQGEIQGEHYFFMEKEEFERRRDSDEFAEWAMVHGNYYGTPHAFIESVVSDGHHIVMDIDVFGKKMLDATYPEAVGILVIPPSMDELEARLRARATDDEDTVRLRLENARTEMEFARTQGKYEYEVINNDLEAAKVEVVRLITEILNG